MSENLEFKASAVGFDKVEAGLKGVNKELVQTGVAAKGANAALANTDKAASSAASEFSALGASLPQLAIAALTALVLTGVSAFIDYATSVSNTTQANIDLNNSLAKSQASVAGQVERLSTLFAIAQNVLKTDQERSEAIGRLNKDYDQFNKSLTLNNINTQESVDLLNKQTAAIIRNAQIKGLENLISKESEKRAEELTKKIGENLTGFQKLRAAIVSINSINGASGVVDAVTTSLDNTSEALKLSTERTNIYTKALQDLLNESASAGDLFTEKFDPLKKAAEKAPAHKKTISDVLDALGRELDFLNAKGFAFNTNESKAKIQAITNTIGDLIKNFNVAPDDTIISKLFGKIELLRPITPQLIDFSKQVEEDIKAFLAKPIVAPINVSLVPGVIDAQPLLVDLGDALNAGLQNLAASAGTAFAESLAGAINGGVDVSGFFDGIFKTIGAGLKSLGQAFVKAGIQILIVKKALTSNPYLAIAAGLALQVLGSLIQNSLSKKQAFAKGGLVPGVGNRDNVDAVLTPGEFVLTKAAVNRIGVDNLSALNKGASIGSVGDVDTGLQLVFIADSRISGNDIVTSYRRASATQGRVG